MNTIAWKSVDDYAKEDSGLTKQLTVEEFNSGKGAPRNSDHELADIIEGFAYFKNEMDKRNVK